MNFSVVRWATQYWGRVKTAVTTSRKDDGVVSWEEEIIGSLEFTLSRVNSGWLLIIPCGEGKASMGLYE